MLHPHLEFVVIGAGQAGLAAGHTLLREGRSFAILEAADQAGGSWPHHYESLTLFSPARYASLPGLPFPGDPNHYPTRDAVTAYLRTYAAHFALPVLLGTRVTRVTRPGNQFIISTANDQHFSATYLIVATGSYQRPFLPDLPGAADFAGRILHSREYTHPTTFAGQRVLVVGAGNSAVQIATELARHAHVTLTSRKPIRFGPQRILDRDIHGWLRATGLDTAPVDTTIGRWFQHTHDRDGRLVIDSNSYRAALAAGRPQWRPLFQRVTVTGVQWHDGTHEPVDAIMCATGYRPQLDYLAGLGALTNTGEPIHYHGVSTTVTNLGFVGFEQQRSFASATLRGVGPDADYVVQTLRNATASAHNVRSIQRRCCGLTLNP